MITSLDFIVKGADIKGLPTKEQISQGYTHFNLLTPRNDNPKLFAWEFLYTDYLVEAVKHWQNQVLVDLGCGRQLDGYIIAKLAGASAYVAVDPYNINKFYQRLISDKESKGDKDFNERIRRVRKLVQKRGYDEKTISTIVNNIDAHLEGNHLPVALIAEDMISALKRLPDNSVSVMTAGLDKCIIIKDKYAELAEEEIGRVLHPQGAYLAICSRLVPKKLLIDHSFEGNEFRKFTKV